MSFALGDVEFAIISTVYYLQRAFLDSGKNIRILIGEVEALARRHGNNFLGDSSSTGKDVYKPLLQFSITSLHNTLRDLEASSLEDDAFIAVFDKVCSLTNDEMMSVAIEKRQLSCLYLVLAYQIIKAFVLRDMDNALKYANMFVEHFMVSVFHGWYIQIVPIDYLLSLTVLAISEQPSEDFRTKMAYAL